MIPMRLWSVVVIHDTRPRGASWAAGSGSATGAGAVTVMCGPSGLQRSCLLGQPVLELVLLDDPHAEVHAGVAEPADLGAVPHPPPRARRVHPQLVVLPEHHAELRDEAR